MESALISFEDFLKKITTFSSLAKLYFKVINILCFIVYDSSAYYRSLKNTTRWNLIITAADNAVRSATYKLSFQILRSAWTKTNSTMFF